MDVVYINDTFLSYGGAEMGFSSFFKFAIY